MGISNIQSNNVFDDFNKLQSSIPVANTNVKGIPGSKEQNNSIAAVKVSEVKKENNNVLQYTLTTSILMAGAAVLIFTKGFSGNMMKRINNLIQRLNTQIYESNVSTKSKNMMQTLHLATTKTVKKILSALKACANFNAVKDSAADKVIRSNKYTARVGNSITTLFKRFASDSIDNAYDSAKIKTDNLEAYVKMLVAEIKDKGFDLNQKVSIKGRTKTLGEWLDNLSMHSDDMQYKFKKGFGKEARLRRTEFREKYLAGIIDENGVEIPEAERIPLNQKVRNALYHDNMGVFKFKENIDRFMSYITENLSNPGKEKQKSIITAARKEFTNNITHNHTAMKLTMQDVSSRIYLKDFNARNLLEQIASSMKEYNSLSGLIEPSQRLSLEKKINVLLSDLNKHVAGTDFYDAETKILIEEQLSFIRDGVLGCDKKGALQEISSIIKGFSRKEAVDAGGNKIPIVTETVENRIHDYAHSLTEDITKAADMEANEVFDKWAEFQVSSAPNDVLGLLFPVGVGVYTVSKAKDKKTKISSTLTTGIPIVGSIGTMLLGAVKSISGPKNLALAAGVGLVLNVVGNFINKLYLDYQDKRSFTQMAIDAYKNSSVYLANKK